ncbi:MAG: Bifunctional protein FolD protein [Legionellaceae bacterium]
MTAQIIDGKKIAAELRQTLTNQISDYYSKYHIKPGLAVIQIGEDPASSIYVRNKRLACEQVGIHSIIYHLPETITEKELLELIHNLNNDTTIHGILVQLPLPKQVNIQTILESIAPHKDVDGFHPYNIGRLAQKKPLLRPCTPYGIMTLLNKININVLSMDAVIIGASNIVGKPMSLELLLAGATVTICHSKTKNIAEHIKRADLLIAAIGQPGFIKTDWIKPNAIIFDVGINRTSDGKIVGDIDFDTAKEIAAWITPVPGGVGPMTVTALLFNTLSAACLQTI